MPKNQAVKYLNLDELIGAPAEVTFKGNVYEVPEMEVEQFLALLVAQREAENAGDDSKAIEVTRELISTLVPSMPKDLIGKMTLRQLRALMEFVVKEVQGSDDEGKAQGLELVTK
jgi:hypothetical protein